MYQVNQTVYAAGLDSGRQEAEDALKDTINQALPGQSIEVALRALEKIQALAKDRTAPLPDSQVGYYFEFKRGSQQIINGKVRLYSEGGRAYMGGITKEEKEGLDLIIDAYFYTTRDKTPYGREKLKESLESIQALIQAKLEAVNTDITNLDKM